MRSSQRMRSSLVVGVPDCKCTSCNGPGFDPSIRRHSAQWNLRGGRWSNAEYSTKKIKKNPPPPKKKIQDPDRHQVLFNKRIIKLIMTYCKLRINFLFLFRGSDSCCARVLHAVARRRREGGNRHQDPLLIPQVPYIQIKNNNKNNLFSIQYRQLLSYAYIKKHIILGNFHCCHFLWVASRGLDYEFWFLFSEFWFPVV